jgi:hypothetical protein
MPRTAQLMLRPFEPHARAQREQRGPVYDAAAG